MIIPKLPTHSSYKGLALAYFLEGNRISHLTFQGQSFSYCLRAPVCELRKSGFKIDNCWNASVNPLSGRKIKYKKYFISDANLQELRLIFGERLGMFIEKVKVFWIRPVITNKN